jgi:proliferating cell nuclear antigen
MFTAHFQEGVTFRKLIESIKDLVTSSHLNCSNEHGLTFESLDSANVSLTTFTLHKKSFESFSCTTPMSLGVEIGSLVTLLKFMNEGDSIHFRATDASDTLSFKFQSPTKSHAGKYELKLMDIDRESLSVPDDVKYSCIFKMPSASFQDICQKSSAAGDTLQITVNKQGVRFSVAGDLLSGGTLYNNLHIQHEEDVNLTFPLKYLHTFSKAKNMSKFVTIKLRLNHPIVVEYKLVKSVNDNKDEKKKSVDSEGVEIGYLRFFLAPKIDDGADGTDGTDKDHNPDKQGEKVDEDMSLEPEPEE